MGLSRIRGWDVKDSKVGTEDQVVEDCQLGLSPQGATPPSRGSCRCSAGGRKNSSKFLLLNISDLTTSCCHQCSGIPQFKKTKHSYGQIALCYLHYSRNAAFALDLMNDIARKQVYTIRDARRENNQADMQKGTDVTLEREQKELDRSPIAVLIHDLVWYPNSGARLEYSIGQISPEAKNRDSKCYRFHHSLQTHSARQSRCYGYPEDNDAQSFQVSQVGK